MKVNAWTALQAGGPLVIKSYEVEAAQGQLVIDVQGCSLTRGDVRFIDNFWPDTKYPLVTGLEVIGKVREDIGSDAKFRPGDLLGVGYQVGACFTCEYCKSGNEQFCAQQQLIPFHANGGVADSIIVDRRFAFNIPRRLRKPEATPLMRAGLTVFTPITHAKLHIGASVGVVGLGGLGHLAVLFLVAMGCKVTVFTHSSHKVDAAKRMGAASVTLDTEEILERSFDFIISCTSEGVDWRRYIRALKPEGELCVVGLPSQPLTFAPELLADYAARKITGNYIGSRTDMERMLAFAEAYDIQAWAKLYTMSDVNTAIDDMRNGRVDFSAVLVRG